MTHAKLSDMNAINHRVELLGYIRDAMKEDKNSAVMLFADEEYDIPPQIIDAILFYHESLLVKELAELGVDSHA